MQGEAGSQQSSPPTWIWCRQEVVINERRYCTSPLPQATITAYEEEGLSTRLVGRCLCFIWRD